MRKAEGPRRLVAQARAPQLIQKEQHIALALNFAHHREVGQRFALFRGYPIVLRPILIGKQPLDDAASHGGLGGRLFHSFALSMVKVVAVTANSRLPFDIFNLLPVRKQYIRVVKPAKVDFSDAGPAIPAGCAG